MCTLDGVTFGTSHQEMVWGYQDRVKRSEDLISEYLGQQLPQPLESVHVFDRLDWIDTNIDGFRDMFEPFEHLNERALQNGSNGSHLVGHLNQAVLTSQLGVLIGYLAQRVLGQYDTALFGKEPVATGKLYFVEPNIAGLQERLGVDPEEFRLWIALHEATHAFEFEANPWMRGYMNSLLGQYLENVSGDLGKMYGESGGNGLGSMAKRIAGNAMKGGNFAEWLMTPAQRAVFSELQAMMCLAEGYSNHVMQAVGEKLLPGYNEMKERFDQRGQNRSSGEQLFIKLTGLDMKYEQYTLGENFVNEIVREGGIDFMNQVWKSPAHLPTMEEIHAPRRWMERVGALVA
jgi:coenzyme F420 biosynthesis associated uncharacterized protein